MPVSGGYSGGTGVSASLKVSIATRRLPPARPPVGEER